MPTTSPPTTSPVSADARACATRLRTRGWTEAAGAFAALVRGLQGANASRSFLVALLDAQRRRDPILAADLLEGADPGTPDPSVDRRGRRRRTVLDAATEASLQERACGAEGPDRVLLGAADAALAEVWARDASLRLWVWDPDPDALDRWLRTLPPDGARIEILDGRGAAPPATATVWIHPALGESDRAQALRMRFGLRRAPLPSSTREHSRIAVLVGPRPFHVEAPLVESLRRAGMAVAVVRVHGDARDEAVADALVETGAYRVISVNGAALARSEVIRAAIEARQLATVLWFVDDPEPALMDALDVVRADHVLGLAWEREAVARLRRLGARGTRYLPHGTRWTGPPPTPLPRVGDLLFVGSSYAGADRRALHEATDLPAAWRRAAHALESGGRGTLAAVRETLASSDPRADLFRQVRLGDAVASRRRADVVRALLPLGLRVFGDPDGWKRLLGPRVPVTGDVDAATVFPALVGGGRVSVDCAHPQMPTAVTQRVFDVPACGGMVLADDRPDLREHFEVGVEVLAWTTPEDAAAQARWILDRPTVRDRMAAAARRRVLAEHTLDHRVRRLLEFADERFGR